MIGASVKEEPSPIKASGRFAVLLHAFLFVLGFSIVFIIGWGGAVTALGQLFGTYKFILGRAGGVIVILFGLATLGIVRIPWFYADTRLQHQGRAGTFANSTLMGLFFAAGWSPCIGATLGAILTLGLSQSTVGQAMWLASGYSLGLAIPFLFLALVLERATGLVQKLRRYQRLFQIMSGFFILAIGILLAGNLMTRIAIWAFQNRFYLDVGLKLSAAPTYLTAIFAGLLSFLSPCVLPLVPAYLGYLSGHTLRNSKEVASMKGFALVSILLAVVLAAGCQTKPATEELVFVAGGSYRDISAEELNGMLKNKDFLLINVHIPFAGKIAGTDLSIPYDQIEQHISQLPADKNSEIVLYCRSGHMSDLAAKTLVKLGYTNIWNLKGGMVDWERAGFGIDQ